MKLQLQFSTIAAAAVLSLSSAVAWAHFGIVIPEHSAVLEQKDANVHFTIAFAHPMERNGMTMAKPDAFYVVQDGRKTDLSGSLKADKLLGRQTTVSRVPGFINLWLNPSLTGNLRKTSSSCITRK